MQILKKIAVGCFFTLAFICLVVGIDEIFDQDVTPNEQQDGRWVLLNVFAFGIPMAASGSWLVWELCQEERDRVLAIFFQQLQHHQGRLTPLQLAMAANLPGTTAKQFLDARAREFEATFEVTETGEIYYCFQPK